jgi:serine phosphatase RsbU (regulator of sigma subunit)/PAS domain-containing protein/anti-sigma regulatory factor (Ser/Thr protein kinase)
MRSVRLDLLASADKEITESEIFRLALQHAVAELAALGGAIHLRGPMPALRLVSSTGLPPALARSWEIVDQEGPTAPASAVRLGHGVWVPTQPPDATQSPDAPGRPVQWPGTGLASVPMSSGDRTIGALTVLMGSHGEPTEKQREFLQAVVAWTEDRMSQAPPPTRPRKENASRTARDILSHALRHMSDGFLLVDDDWRITFANVEAERTLGAAEEELFGHILWELPVIRHVPDLEARCRKAATEATEATPVGFDIRTTDTGRCHHLRFVPGPDGLTLYLTDVTDKRQRESERSVAVRAASERSAWITELTTALAKAKTSRDVVDAVAQQVLPPFGASGVAVWAIEGDRAHVIGGIGYSPEFLDQINGRPATANDPIWEAHRTPLFIPSPEEYIKHYPHLADRPRLGGKQAWAFLPLTVSGHTFATYTISFNQPRTFSYEEQTLLIAISALIAHALERARLYDAAHTRSKELQRGLLPQQLPELSACTAAARFLPAGQGMDVGGDWYDVIPLPAGRVALVVGDVMGHGLSEAATMGRLRTAVKTLADLELPPDEVMSHLNDIVSGLGEDSYATCLYALYDSTTRICTIARAGHPPPAVVQPDGTVYFPELSLDPPLGAAGPPFETVELELPDESLLVLYTDGLVESAGREVDQGMAELERLLSTTDHADLDRLCDTLTTRLLPHEQSSANDDTALLIGRVHALAADQMASWQLPEDPRAAGQARKYIREQLSLWGLDDLTMTTELIGSELVGNVVRHAKGPVHLRLLHSAGLICEVSDGSLTMPRIRRASETDEGGRGLQLVATLSQRWGTRYTAAGKCIWTEQTLSDGPNGQSGQPWDSADLLALADF